MKIIKSALSFVLVICLVASLACVADISVSANADDATHTSIITDVVNSDPDNQAETETYYFYIPPEWRNKYNDYYYYNPETKNFDGKGGYFAAGLYWSSGPYTCFDYSSNKWPGYAVTETLDEDSNIFVAKVPKNAGGLILNNLVNGGMDESQPYYLSSVQTYTIPHRCYVAFGDEYGLYYEDYHYDEYTEGFYPEGISESEGFNGKIFVVNPKSYKRNSEDDKYICGGVWFYYYGNGEYGYYKTREEAAKMNEIYKNGQFPDYEKRGERTSGYYTYILLDDGTVKITGYYGPEKDVHIPSELDGHPVSIIGGNSRGYDDDHNYYGAFNSKKYVESVTIPDGVKTIERFAFYGCKKLSKISIPDSVTSIGERAFDYTAYMSDTNNYENGVLYIDNHLIDTTGDVSGSYSIKEGTVTIAYGALSGCNVTNVIIPDSVKTIGDEAFSYCTQLESITIPDSTTYIGDGAFMYCYKLESVKLGKNVTTIGRSAFASCAIKSISIPKGIKTIDAFNNCKNLSSVSLPDGLESISGFSHCESLKSIKIPESVTDIESHTFDGCTSLESINIPKAIKSIRECAISRCKSLKSIKLPEGVTDIGRYAFWECSSLESINIPKAVKSIGKSAFEECKKLKTIKTSAKKIGEEAFINCEGLETVYLEYGVEKINKKAFAGCTSLKFVFTAKSVKDINPKAFIKKLQNKPVWVYEKWLDAFGNVEFDCIRIPMNSTFKVRLSGDNSVLPILDYSDFYLSNKKNTKFIKEYKANIKNIKSSNKKIARIKKNGEFYFLDKGKVKLSAVIYGKKITRTVKCSLGPGISKKKITVRLYRNDNSSGYYFGYDDSVYIERRVPFIKNKLYYNKKRIKVKYGRTNYGKDYNEIFIKGLKKGKTTLKVRANGVKTLKIKIKVV